MDRHKLTYNKGCSEPNKPCLYHRDGCNTIVCHELSCCSDHSPKTLSEIIYSIDKELVNYSNKEYNYKVYGYQKPKDLQDNFSILEIYRDLLIRYRTSLLFNYEPCLNCSDIQKIIEKVKKEIGSECKPRDRKDITIDCSGKALWDSTNPYCVSREKWEALAYRVCDAIGINIALTDLTKVCDIYIGLKSNPIMCEVLYELSLHKQNCDLGIKLTRSKKECKVDYDILVKKHSCELSFNEYIKLIDCNISYKLVQKVYECGMSLEINRSDDLCPIVVSVTGEKLPICDIKFNTLVNTSNCESIFNQ